MPSSNRIEKSAISLPTIRYASLKQLLTMLDAGQPRIGAHTAIGKAATKLVGVAPGTPPRSDTRRQLRLLDRLGMSKPGERDRRCRRMGTLGIAIQRLSQLAHPRAGKPVVR